MSTSILVPFVTMLSIHFVPNSGHTQTQTDTGGEATQRIVIAYRQEGGGVEILLLHGAVIGVIYC